MRPIQIPLLASFAILILSLSMFAAGVVDRSFGTNGSVTTQVIGQSLVVDVLFQSDGKSVATISSDYPMFQLVRYMPNGSLDPTYGTNGIATINLNIRVWDAEILSDGKILVAGVFFPGNGSSDFGVIRILPNGTVDTTFGTNGLATVNQGTNDTINKIAIQSDGKIVCAGYTSDANGMEAVLRLNANGSLDTSFGSGGLYLFRFPPIPQATFFELTDVKILGDGRILTGSPDYITQTGLPSAGYALLMLSAHGSPDTSFGSQGIVSASEAVIFSNLTTIGFETLPDGNIFIAYAGGISLLNSTGGLVRKLPFEGYKTQLTSDGKVLVWGDSLSFAGRVGYVKLYSERNIIGIAAGPDQPFAAPDGRIISAMVDPNTNLLLVKRFSRLTSQGTRIADFDRDGKADLAFQRGSFFYCQKSGGGSISHLYTEPYSQVIPELSSYRLPNGETRRDSIVYAVRGIPNILGGAYRQISESGTFYYNQVWGLAGDIPSGGDFDGDGLVDMTVFRPSDGVWYSIFGENGAFHFVRWGSTGDKPVPADYDYDGITDRAVYRPSTGTWWILKSSDGGSIAFTFGLSTDIPLTGDYDGDGRADFTVYRPSEGNWYQYLTAEGFRVTRFGLAADLPVPGDYDGDGRHDIALYRSGIWYLLKSTEGFAAVTLPNVLPTDLPVSVRYDQ